MRKRPWYVAQIVLPLPFPNIKCGGNHTILPENEFSHLIIKRVFFKISTSEQHTATDLVNLLYFLRPVSSDHTDFVREFEQDG